MLCSLLPQPGFRVRIGLVALKFAVREGILGSAVRRCPPAIGCGGFVLPQNVWDPLPLSLFLLPSPFPSIQYCTSWNQREFLDHICLAIGRGWIERGTLDFAVPRCRVRCRQSQPPCQHLDPTLLNSRPASQKRFPHVRDMPCGTRRLTSVSRVSILSSRTLAIHEP